MWQDTFVRAKVITKIVELTMWRFDRRGWFIGGSDWGAERWRQANDPPSSQLVRELANVHHALVQNLNFIKLKFDISRVRVLWLTRLKNQLLALFFATISDFVIRPDTHKHTDAGPSISSSCSIFKILTQEVIDNCFTKAFGNLNDHIAQMN